MTVSIEAFCINNNLKYTEAEKALIRFSGMLKNHIIKKDKIFIDSFAQELIKANIKERIRMTIKEFCDLYGCDKSGVYRKIKRLENKELKDHVTFEKGKAIMIDDYAVDLLIPDKYKKIKNVTSENENLRKKINELSGKVSELESENIQLKNMIEMR